MKEMRLENSKIILDQVNMNQLILINQILDKLNFLNRKELFYNKLELIHLVFLKKKIFNIK